MHTTSTNSILILAYKTDDAALLFHPPRLSPPRAATPLRCLQQLEAVWSQDGIDGKEKPNPLNLRCGVHRSRHAGRWTLAPDVPSDKPTEADDVRENQYLVHVGWHTAKTLQKDGEHGQPRVWSCPPGCAPEDLSMAPVQTDRPNCLGSLAITKFFFLSLSCTQGGCDMSHLTGSRHIRR